MTDRFDAAGSPGDGRAGGPAHDGPTVPMEAVARRTPTGWRVGDEEVPDLTSAMVLADLLAAELSAEEQAELDSAAPAPPAPRDAASHNTGQLGGMSSPPPSIRPGRLRTGRKRLLSGRPTPPRSARPSNCARLSSSRRRSRNWSAR